MNTIYHVRALRTVGVDATAVVWTQNDWITSGQPVVSASAHNPVNAGVLPVDSMVTYHTYSARFMREMPYVSDSNQAWRQWHPLDLVERRQTFHLLLHPLWWVLPGHDWEMKLREVERRANERYSAFMASEIERQRVSLQNRSQLDLAFAAQADAGN